MSRLLVVAVLSLLPSCTQHDHDMECRAEMLAAQRYAAKEADLLGIIRTYQEQLGRCESGTPPPTQGRGER